MKYKNISVIANHTEKAFQKLKILEKKLSFNLFSLDQEIDKNTDLIIVLGGDGFMLHCLHQYMHLKIPFYGINCGIVGFLLNHFDQNFLIDKINNSTPNLIPVLEMTCHLSNGEIKTNLAINEVSLFRKTNQAAKIMVTVDDEVRLAELICDGILLATPAGSSAYNLSVNGPILPIGSNILALTPISPFFPKRWSGAILPHTAKVTLDILESEKRPVNAVADYYEVSSIKKVVIRERFDLTIPLLFDINHSLEERILKAQFNH